MEKALSEKIVIADSGATKTDWCLVQGGEILKRFFTHGISPVYQTEAEMAKEIRLHVYPQLRELQFRSIRFYGTGCIPEKSAAVSQALIQSFPIEEIQVYSDLIGRGTWPLRI